MFQNKVRVLASSSLAVVIAASSFAFAADEHGKLHDVMEKVNKVNNGINKAVRTPVAYKKDTKAVTDNAKELLKLAKETAACVDDAKKIKGVKDAEAQWKTLAADFLKVTEELAKVAEKEEHAATKTAHTAVKKSCTGCHEVFRIDDEN